MWYCNLSLQKTNVHIDRQMAKTTDTEPSFKATGKMFALQWETPYFTDPNPAENSKAIEVRLYQKWTATKVPTVIPTYFCCILLDKKVYNQFWAPYLRLY